MKHLISIQDLSREQIESLLSLAKEMKQRPHPGLLEKKILATLFFEPSTRTRLSFESAMLRLGGKVMGFADGAVSSASKGETLADTIRVISSYADGIVIRHPYEGAARLAADHSSIPIINGGDGAREHPSQTLLDLFTIQETQGRLDGIHIACIGDLKHGRTVHSLALAAARFQMRLYFVAPPSLMPPDYLIHQLRASGVKYSFHASLKEISSKADILYMVRTQKERFADPSEYERCKSHFSLKKEDLKEAKPHLKILHPLPRVDEIHTEIDALPQAHYFEQAANGVYLRQALLSTLLGGSHA